MIDIALCFDNNFVMQAGVFITSLLMTNDADAISMHIVSDNLSEESRLSLMHITRQFHAQISFYEFDIDKISSFPIGAKNHLSLATYYRILLPEIVPPALHKVLYVDCDMLAVDSLEELWNTDVSSYSCAACADMFYDDQSIGARLGYDIRMHYFNAGMLLLNLDWWRKNNVSEKIITYISTFPEKCHAHDQDALNAVLHGTIRRVSARYNIQLDFLKKNYSNMVIADTEVLHDAVTSWKNPCIIHFTGPSKPWKYQCFNPFEPLWHFFQNMTQWRNLPKEHEFGGWKLLKWKIKNVFSACNIVRSRTNEYISVSDKIIRIENTCKMRMGDAL